MGLAGSAIGELTGCGATNEAGATATATAGDTVEGGASLPRRYPILTPRPSARHDAPASSGPIPHQNGFLSSRHTFRATELENSPDGLTSSTVIKMARAARVCSS